MNNICTNCTRVSQSCWLYFLAITSELEREREGEGGGERERETEGKTYFFVKNEYGQNLGPYTVLVLIWKERKAHISPIRLTLTERSMGKTSA